MYYIYKYFEKNLNTFQILIYLVSKTDSCAVSSVMTKV